MTELGLIHTANNGTYYLLPVLQRSIEKLTAIVDEEMSRIGGQKMTLPILTPADLWNQTGRLKDIGREVMTSIDRHNHTQILSPVNIMIGWVMSAWAEDNPHLIPDERGECNCTHGHAIADIVQTVAN